MDIKVNEDRCTNISTIEAGYEYENLAYKINFKFPDYLNQFNKLIEFEYGDTKTYDALLNDEYIFKDNITRYSIVACQIVFAKSVGDEEVQVYKTNIFYVKFGNSINADKNIDPSDENINVLNTLISEVNSLKNELTLTIEEVNKNEEIRNEKVDTAIATIKDLTDEYNTNAENKTNEFNSNASTKTNEYNDNTTTKLSEYNTNANSKVEEYNSNATQKTNTFNENATTQTETFNNNATSKTNDFNSNASSKTDEFNTNYEEKLESINEASTSIEQERVISDGKYAHALKTQVEDIEQIQVYAENPEVENLVIRGAELTQKTREGYNLVDFKSPDEIYVSDFNFQNDILTITSSSGTFRQIIYDITNLMLANAGKVLSFWYSNIDFSQGKSPAVQITLTKNDNTKSYTQLLSASLVKSNFNIPDNISEYSSLKLGILCNNTSESSNASITIIKPMLLIGIEEKPYEEYGASPSLDYPSEIQVAKEQNISIEGKNKCRGWMNTTSTAVYGNAFLIKADLKPNTKYTISFLTPTFKAEYYRAEELTSNWFTVINNGKRQSYTFTTKADISNAYKEYNGEYGYILFKNAIATPSPANFSDVMLVKGDTDVPYEPYYRHDVNIPLTNNSIGNYFDVIDRENKVQDKVIQELILTGNENYNFDDVENGIYQYSITPAKKPIYINDSIIRVMSNYFKGVGQNGSWNIDNSITLNTSNIRFMTSQYTTVEDFKAKIKELYEAGKPVKIYYVPETIDKIPLSEEIKQELNKFKLYDDLNNVLIDKGSLSFKYNKSLSKELEEKDEMIDNLLTRVQVLEQAQVNSVGGN